MAIERQSESSPDERPPRVWRIPVETYHRMIDCGALDANDRLELIDGFLLAKWEAPAAPPIVEALWRDSRWAQVGKQLWPVSVDKYHRMIDGGVFDGAARVDLIGGVLVERSPQSKAHVFAVRRLAAMLTRALPEETWSVRPQAPMSLPGWEPEPDVAVVRQDDDVAAARHPRSAALVTYREPRDAAYATHAIAREHGTIHPVAFPAVAVKVAERMLPCATP